MTSQNEGGLHPCSGKPLEGYKHCDCPVCPHYVSGKPYCMACYEAGCETKQGDESDIGEAIVRSSADWLTLHQDLPMCGRGWRAAFMAGVEFQKQKQSQSKIVAGFHQKGQDEADKCLSDLIEEVEQLWGVVRHLCPGKPSYGYKACICKSCPYHASEQDNPLCPTCVELGCK